MIHTAFCRRVLALALTGATLLSLTACGQEPTDGTTEPTVATQPATEVTVPTEATVTETVPETVPEPVETAPPETEPTEPGIIINQEEPKGNGWIWIVVIAAVILVLFAGLILFFLLYNKRKRSRRRRRRPTPGQPVRKPASQAPAKKKPAPMAPIVPFDAAAEETAAEKVVWIFSCLTRPR